MSELQTEAYRSPAAERRMQMTLTASVSFTYILTLTIYTLVLIPGRICSYFRVFSTVALLVPTDCLTSLFAFFHVCRGFRIFGCLLLTVQQKFKLVACQMLRAYQSSSVSYRIVDCEF